MDIFTILVFFLLINSGDVEILQTDDSLELPSSMSEQVPEEQLLMLINTDNIIIAGRPFVDLFALNQANSTVDGNPEQQVELDFTALVEELKYRESRKTSLTETEQVSGLAVTIMADKETPYSLLKQIMTVCAENNYRDISLAVNQVASVTTELLSPDESLLDSQSVLGSSESILTEGATQ